MLSLFFCYWFSSAFHKLFKVLNVVDLLNALCLVLNGTCNSLNFGLKMQRAIVRGAAASSVGKGVFHVRTRPSEQPMTILKYYLQPNFTPVPLRFRYCLAIFSYFSIFCILSIRCMVLIFGKNLDFSLLLFVRVCST